MKKKGIGLLMIMFSSLIIAGCGKEIKETNSDAVETIDEEQEEVIDVKKIAVFLAESESVSKKSEIFRTKLEESGHEVNISFADHDFEIQKGQIEEQLSQEADVLVIEPASAYGLSEVLAQAGTLGIPVISYDELIMDTQTVSYYVTYNYRLMGQMTGEAIKAAKNLDEAVNTQTSYNIEFLMGSQDSLEALIFYNGVMEILQPYFDAGVLICTSGKSDFDTSGVLRWDAEQAKKRCEEIYQSYYQEGETLDIICTGFDEAAISVAEVFETLGYAIGSESWPVITGLGCKADVVEAITQGKIHSSIYMDESLMMESCIKMADACAKGETVEINDVVQYDNGVKIVEANVCEAKLYTIENIAELSLNEAKDEKTAEGEDELDSMIVEHLD